MADRGVDEALLGRIIAGKFQIESFVGAGAMGAVYKARQIALEKTVAIKVMHRDIAKDDTFATRFKREAKAASKLDHPNSMRVMDFGAEPDGLLYMAMEYLDGKDLFTVLKDGWPIRDDRIVDILMQALAALQAAHDQGVVHRDLKPENLMILEGNDDEGHSRDIVKVCDFGIAKITETRADKSKESSAKLSTRGIVVGTPEYMSPEQGRGESLDPRSDLYSMGVILYQLLTGKVPFDAESALGIVLKHVTEEPERPSKRVANLNARLEAVCMRAMKKDRTERYQTAREMRNEVRQAVAGARTVAMTPYASYPDLTPPPPTSGENPNRLSWTSAATVPLDPSVVAAAQRTSSKVTPAGTEAVEIPGVKRRTGFVVAFVLLAATGLLAVAVYKARMKQQADAQATPTQQVSTSVVEPPVTVAMTGSTSEPPPIMSPTASTPGGLRPTTTSRPQTAGGSNTTVAPPASTVAPAATPSGSVAVTPPASGEGHVEIGGIKTTGALKPPDVKRALMPADFNDCYRALPKKEAFKGALQLEVDDSGHVTSATMPAPAELMPAVRCIVKVMAGRIVPNTDKAGTADVDLSFVP